eukprot:jgi/Ulvmu1/4854/UM020_0140.1
MQSYLGGSSRLQQTVSARRLRSRVQAEGLPPLPSLQELNSVVQPNAFATVADAVSSSTTSTIADSVDAITDAVSSSGVDAAAASSIPVEYLGLGALGIVAVVAIGAFAANNKSDAGSSSTSKVSRQPPPRKNAVLVFGSTGKAGKQVVKELLASGRTVVAATRAPKPDTAAWAELGVKEGKQSESGGILFFESGVDITDPATLKKDIFRGATQVVIACGAVSRQDAKGFEEGLTPEAVDAKGVSNVVSAIAANLPTPQFVKTPIMQASDVGGWQIKDDVIMGGKSSSSISVAEGSNVAEWAGELVVEGGGFCGTASPDDSMDLSAYDGIALRVKGNGETFKFNIKTSDQVDEPVQAYQATFDTVPGDWVTVTLPWHGFVPVKMASWNPDAPPLDPAKIRTVGIVYSRFDLNGIANPNYKPGAFKLSIEGGLAAFTAPRPAVVLLTSAGTERNAVIGDDVALRKADIPIVQLNPAGTLNWKYKGETALRASGIAYSIIRPTGLIREADPDDGKPYTLEFSQGDVIAGRVSRADVASVVSSALQEPAALGATFEVRRTERWDVGGPAKFSAASAKVEFLKLVKDTERRRAGLRPMPAWVPPPEPVPEERVKEILADPRVQEQLSRDPQPKEETVEAAKPEAKEPEAKKEEVKPVASATGLASMSLRQAAVNQWIADYRSRNDGAPDAAPEAAAPAAALSEEEITANRSAVDAWISAWQSKAPAPLQVDVGEVKARQEEVAAWISSWQAKVPEPVKAVAEAVEDAADDIQHRQADVQAWIDAWQSKPAPTNGASSGNGASQRDEVEAWIAKWRAKSGAAK